MRLAPDVAMTTGELVVRRARFHIALQFALALLLAGFACYYGWSQYLAEEGSTVGTLLIVGLLVTYAVQVGRQCLDRTPIVIVGPAGLTLPPASPDPIAWPRVRHLGASRSLALVGGGRLDLQVDPEIYVRLKLGQRFLGDPIVKMARAPYGVSVIAQGLDHSAAAIFAAIHRHWPPPEEAPDDDRAPDES
jgi:hypothetical protein